MSEQVPERREPLLNAPWPAVALVAAMVAAYVAQLALGDAAVAARYGFAPADLDEGRLFTLLTYQFLHGGWPHVGMNALWAMAFAPPVARLLGPAAAGVIAFFVFYLLCGAFAAIGFSLLQLHQAFPPLVGASGAVAGLMGAASRLIYRTEGLTPLTDRRVVTMGLAWGGINVVLGMIGFAPGMGQVTIAWEAHLAGYLAGLLMIGPLARLLRRA